MTLFVMVRLVRATCRNHNKEGPSHLKAADL
jgi:hypothetical protein